jgi:enoyl-CoA hydratase/carnithine racemase
LAGKLEENTFENLIVEKKDNVMWITLDRPEKLNALNKDMYTELHKILDIVEMDS